MTLGFVLHPHTDLPQTTPEPKKKNNIKAIHIDHWTRPTVTSLKTLTSHLAFGL